MIIHVHSSRIQAKNIAIQMSSTALHDTFYPLTVARWLLAWATGLAHRLPIIGHLVALVACHALAAFKTDAASFALTTYQVRAVAGITSIATSRRLIPRLCSGRALRVSLDARGVVNLDIGRSAVLTQSTCRELDTATGLTRCAVGDGARASRTGLAAIALALVGNETARCARCAGFAAGGVCDTTDAR